MVSILIYMCLIYSHCKKNVNMKTNSFQKVCQKSFYRPISFYPFVFNILKIFIYNCLCSFLKKSKTISKNEFGFVWRHSISHLTFLTDNKSTSFGK